MLAAETYERGAYNGGQLVHVLPPLGHTSAGWQRRFPGTRGTDAAYPSCVYGGAGVKLYLLFLWLTAVVMDGEYHKQQHGRY